MKPKINGVWICAYGIDDKNSESFPSITLWRGEYQANKFSLTQASLARLQRAQVSLLRGKQEASDPKQSNGAA